MILQRYIAKTIISMTLLVMLVVLALVFFIDLLGELRDIGTGDYDFMDAVQHVLLLLPHRLYQLSPMLVLLGGVMGLGVLSSHQELIVMRTSGISVHGIIRAVSIAAIVLIIILMFIGEAIAPRAIFLSNKGKESAENGGQAVATVSGVWMHEGNNFLHIDQVMGYRHLEGVTRYQFDDQHRLLATYYAKIIEFDRGEWVLRDVVRTTFERDKTHSTYFAKTTWDLALNPNLLNIGLIEPEEMSLRRLAEYSKNLVKNGSHATAFQLEFWQRIFQPLTILVMMLLAVPFVFGAPRSVTMGWRILFGILIGFIFYMLNTLLGQLSIVFQLSPLFIALFPTLLVGLLVYVFILRI